MTSAESAGKRRVMPREFIGYEDEYDIAVHEMEGMYRTGKIFIGLIRDGFYESEDISVALAGVAADILGLKAPRVLRLDMHAFLKECGESFEERVKALRERLDEKVDGKGWDLVCIFHQELMTEEETAILKGCGANVVYTSTRRIDDSIKLNVYRTTPEKALEALARRDLVRFIANDMRPLSDRGNIPLDNAETFLRRHGTEVPCSYEIIKAVERHRTVDNVCYPDPGHYLSNWRSVLANHTDQDALTSYLKLLGRTGKSGIPERFLRILCRAGSSFTLDSVRTLLEIFGSEEMGGVPFDRDDTVRDLIGWGIIYRRPSERNEDDEEQDRAQRFAMSDYVRAVLLDRGMKDTAEREVIIGDLRGCILGICDDPSRLRDAYRDTHTLSSLLVSYLELGGEKVFWSDDAVMERIFQLINGGFFTFQNADTADAVKRMHEAMKRIDVRKMRNGELKLDPKEFETRLKIISRYVSEMVNGNDPSERTIVPMILGKTYKPLITGAYGENYESLGTEDLDRLRDFATCQSEITIYTQDHLVGDDTDVRFFRRLTEVLHERHGVGSVNELLEKLDFEGSYRPSDRRVAATPHAEAEKIRDMLRECIFNPTVEGSAVAKREAPVRFHMQRYLVDLFGLVDGTKPRIGELSEARRVEYRDIRDFFVLFEWLRQRCGVMEGCDKWADHPLNLLFLAMQDRFSPVGPTGARELLYDGNTRTQDYARVRIDMYGAYNIMKNHGYTDEKEALEPFDARWIIDTINSREERDVINGEISIQNAYQYIDNQTLYNVERTLANALESTDFQCRAKAYDCLSVSYGVMGKISEAAQSYLTASRYYGLAGKTALMMLMRARAAFTALSAGDVRLAVESRDRLKDYVEKYETDAPLTCRMIRECLKNCY